MNSRKALIVGVDHYQQPVFRSLSSCVSDALAVQETLAEHGVDPRRRNFDCRLLLAPDQSSPIRRLDLRQEVEELFSGNAGLVDVALFYFAGHGAVCSTGGYLLGSDASDPSDGLPLADLIQWAKASRATHRVIILDCCHAGAAAAMVEQPGISTLADGMTVLAASTSGQVAKERLGGGLFTTLMVEALRGGAANLAGQVTPGSVYAFVDQSLGSRQQRPVFKANVQTFVSLRDNTPPIDPADLLRITTLFSSKDAVHQLDMSYEPNDLGREPGDLPADPVNVGKFAILQAYNRLHLVVPEGAPHMWNAAKEKKACRLTPLGKHYWRLVKEDLL